LFPLSSETLLMTLKRQQRRFKYLYYIFLCEVVVSVWCCVCRQIYSEYVQVSSALQTEKAENKRLSDYLDQIMRVSCCTMHYNYLKFTSGLLIQSYVDVLKFMGLTVRFDCRVMQKV